MKRVTNIQTIFAFSFSDGENQIAADLIWEDEVPQAIPKQDGFFVLPSG